MACTILVSVEDLWRGSICGGLASILALVFILICHFFCSKKNVFSFLSRFRTSSFAIDRNADRNASSMSTSHLPQLRIVEPISEMDLKSLLDDLDGKVNKCEKWETVVEKNNNLLSYSAKCSKPKDGPLKYSSVTTFENCSPKLLRDFYMDSDYRKLWDKTLLEHEQLEVDKTSGIEVGRFLKKFPLLTPREYILSWRLWEGKDGTFYCITKECKHHLAPQQKKYVRVTFYRSGWRIRRVSGRDACEISMFHQEDAGVNVEMAKLAFAKGIWSFVCKMNDALRKYALINNPHSSSLITAVTLMNKVPDGIEDMSDMIPEANSVASGSDGKISSEDKKLCRRPSKKLVANGLLLLGGVICLCRGNSSLGAKVAMAYILTKLGKRPQGELESRHYCVRRGGGSKKEM